MKAAAIIVAAGSGKRFGSKTPKQFLPLSGKPVFLWSAETFASIKVFKQIIVAVPKRFINDVDSRFSILNSQLTFTSGGKERFDSVKNALALIDADVDYIAVHDAARPLINKKDILAVLKKAAKGGGGCIAAEKTKDTIKTVKDGYVKSTLDRSVLYNIQTPQIFKAELLFKAYSKNIPAGVTDDSALIEKLGVKVAVEQTKFPNFKITTKQDFETAEFIVQSAEFR
jgi:2-C-methyl-D-erythritol 4-phosphate cytidylyltransferase